MAHNNVGVGVPDSYKKDAKNKSDVLWKVKIKGRKFLADDIPLHVSLRVFDDLSKEGMEEVKRKVKELGICTPDPKKLTFKTTIFHSRHNHKDYYMLKISGMDAKCEEFFNHFKTGFGFSHPKFMSHVTIDKHLYDAINKDGLEPDEVEFSDLTIENGASNTVHQFEDLEKGIKHVGAALGVAASMMGNPTQAKPTHAGTPAARQASIAPMSNQYSSKRMLNTIASVESRHGKLENHKPLSGINHGESAIGKYALTPNIIRETIHLNRDLKQKHGKAINLRGDDMKRYMQDNPGLEDTIAQKHLQRLEHHFGQDPGKLGYAWLQGIRGTYKADKEKKDISNHWHVKKIKDAYSKEK